jgi:putative hydrolase of the HAD superfamily
MKAATIKAVLFDFGGVLAEEGFRNGLQALAQAQGLDVQHICEQGTQAVYDSGFVLGQGSAADFWSLLRQRTGLVGEGDALSETILAGFVLRPWMMARVQQLRERGYITGILSDQTHWLDDLEARAPFKHAFDRVFNSYYLGKGKRDPSLFEDVAAELGLAPASILFVDDDAGNVARARAAGLQAIQYIERKDFEAALEKTLAAPAGA